MTPTDDQKPASAHQKHEATSESGANPVSPPMPDLAALTPENERPMVTEPANDTVEGDQTHIGHAGIGGAPGWDATADDAGRDPSSLESKQAKGKAPKPTTN